MDQSDWTPSLFFQTFPVGSISFYSAFWLVTASQLSQLIISLVKRKVILAFLLQQIALTCFPQLPPLKEYATFSWHHLHAPCSIGYPNNHPTNPTRNGKFMLITQKIHPHLFQHIPTKKSKLHQFFPQKVLPHLRAAQLPSRCRDPGPRAQGAAAGHRALRGPGPFRCGGRRLRRRHQAQRGRAERRTGNRGWMDIWVDSKVGIRDFCSTFFSVRCKLMRICKYTLHI